jgi:hypothetical protein
MIMRPYRVPAVTGQPATVGVRGVVPLYRPPARRPMLPFPWGADHPWGLTRAGNDSFTIAAGEFEAGGGVVLSTGETTFTITEDAQYIGLEYDPAAGTLSLIAPSTDKPGSEAGKFKTWLYLFSYVASAGVAKYERHNLTGAWHGALFAMSP